jgi:hypothetical protein
MSRQARRRSSPQSTPAAAPTRPQPRPQALAPGRGAAPARGNAAAQEQVAEEQTGTTAAGPAPAPDWRTEAITAYEDRLWEVISTLVELEDAGLKAARARAVLGQAAEVHFAIKIGEPVDVALLPMYPPGEEGALPTGAFPPQWIRPARLLLEMAGGSGASSQFHGTGDGPAALWDGGETQQMGPFMPWAGDLENLKTIGRRPADYGVNQYQTQSNNLASPEATCNGTSLSMVLERLGYSRQDLIEAIETKLKRTQYERSLRAQGLSDADVRKKMTEFDPACVALTTEAWKSRVLTWLREENERGSGYQRLRGASQTDRQLQTWAGEFRDNAGMDDLALFIMDLLDIERTTVNSGSNPEKLVSFVHDGIGAKTAKPTSERLDAGVGWTNAKARLKDCLEDGGAAMLSIRHKGRGSSGTHIVAVQVVESGGVRVDDPYGGAREDYRGNKAGDAYALPGKGRSDSGLRNQVDASRDDWKMSAEVSSDETRGASTFWSDDLVRTSLNYVQLFHRGRPAAVAPAQRPAADAGQHAAR